MMSAMSKRIRKKRRQATEIVLGNLEFLTLPENESTEWRRKNLRRVLRRV